MYKSHEGQSRKSFDILKDDLLDVLQGGFLRVLPLFQAPGPELVPARLRLGRRLLLIWIGALCGLHEVSQDILPSRYSPYSGLPERPQYPKRSVFSISPVTKSISLSFFSLIQRHAMQLEAIQAGIIPSSPLRLYPETIRRIFPPSAWKPNSRANGHHLPLASLSETSILAYLI